LPDRPIEPPVPPQDDAENATPEQLFAALYEDLRNLAQRELRRRGSSLTLGATTLLHEAYLTLHDRHGLLFPDRAHFLAYAARAMRGLIVDAVRSRMALKRGAGLHRVTLPTDIPEQGDDATDVLRLSEAVEQLAALDSRLAQVVELRYFGGFSISEIAAMWNMSERTVERDWEKARLLLHRMVSSADPE
jgi:RNA polymerase sigma factor (TIGR02999 family)